LRAVPAPERARALAERALAERVQDCERGGGCARARGKRKGERCLAARRGGGARRRVIYRRVLGCRRSPAPPSMSTSVRCPPRY
jgi:hypothetical protein